MSKCIPLWLIQTEVELFLFGRCKKGGGLCGKQTDMKSKPSHRKYKHGKINEKNLENHMTGNDTNPKPRERVQMCFNLRSKTKTRRLHEEEAN